MQGRLFLAAIASECAAILQLPPGEDPPLLARWDTSPILDHSLDVAKSVLCLIKDLHATTQPEHQCKADSFRLLQPENMQPSSASPPANINPAGQVGYLTYFGPQPRHR